MRGKSVPLYNPETCNFEHLTPKSREKRNMSSCDCHVPITITNGRLTCQYTVFEKSPKMSHFNFSRQNIQINFNFWCKNSIILSLKVKMLGNHFLKKICLHCWKLRLFWIILTHCVVIGSTYSK